MTLWVVIGTANTGNTSVIERGEDVGNRKFAGCPLSCGHLVSSDQVTCGEAL